MYDLFLIGLGFAAAHLAALYFGIFVFRLEYAQILTLNVGLVVAMSLLIRISLPLWKDRLVAALKREARDGEALPDALAMVLTVLGTSLASAVILFRRFGAVGWLGLVGSSALVNWLI
jgi:hypothetical protein